MSVTHKTVIGLNLKNHLKAVAASLVAAVALTLPYIHVSGEKKSIPGAIVQLLSGSESTAFIWLLVGAAIFTAVSAALSLIENTIFSYMKLYASSTFVPSSNGDNNPRKRRNYDDIDDMNDEERKGLSY
jgi:hypothetical protein